ncbi:hypothetical protein B0H19DRAFT_1385404 [Mycena capillaripes]|nr:hypothetical protein B0H19DRAFT_1385404 [Mycena capillaripes]
MSSESGYMSVPATNVSSDSDSDSDSDDETKSAFASLKMAQERVAQIHGKKTAVRAALAEPKAKQPMPGKREIARNAERPQWTEEADNSGTTKPRPSGARSALSAPSTSKVKIEDVARPITHPRVKTEVLNRKLPFSSSPSDVIIISGDESDDDEVQLVDSSNIEVVIFEHEVGLKKQHPRVEKTLQFAVEYFLGYYIFRCSFPSTEQKHVFAGDALLNAAHRLELLDVRQRLMTDNPYRNLLAPLLHARASTFRLKAKVAAELTVVTNYGLRKNTEPRVVFPTTGMRYIYPLSLGPIDPTTGLPGPDLVDNSRPYMVEGIHAPLSQAFFKSEPSIASKHSELFPTNEETGQTELPAPMVALVATAVHASLNEHRTGRHVPSKFDSSALVEVYDTHMLILNKLQKSNSSVLADPYTEMVSGSRLGNIATKPMALQALAVLGPGY